MTAHIEKHLIIVNEYGTEYRIRPNPDADPGDDAGVVLDYRDSVKDGWKGYFFVSPDAVDLLAGALMDIRK